MKKNTKNTVDLKKPVNEFKEAMVNYKKPVSDEELVLILERIFLDLKFFTENLTLKNISKFRLHQIIDRASKLKKVLFD